MSRKYPIHIFGSILSFLEELCHRFNFVGRNTWTYNRESLYVYMGVSFVETVIKKESGDFRKKKEILNKYYETGYNTFF